MTTELHPDRMGTARSDSVARFDMNGLHLRRDPEGTIHVTGAPAVMISLVIDDQMKDGPVAFCIHDGSEGCPGEQSAGRAQLNNWVRWFVPERSGAMYADYSYWEAVL